MGKLISKAAVKLTEGVFAYSVDVLLWTTVYVAELMLPAPASGKVWRAGIAADRFTGGMNYEVIKNALITARRNGWIKKGNRKAQPEITAEGKRRLAATIPMYDAKRVWDGRLHLVTYDIPEALKTKREMLRGYLRRIGCAKLQDSVWITPYNPIDTLRTFIEEKELGGTIIISDMGKDGSIGEEDIRGLLVRVYKFEELNRRYETWLQEVGEHGSVDQYLLIGYLSILKDDPQLPFHLLPVWWKGDKAYALAKGKLNKLSSVLL